MAIKSLKMPQKLLEKENRRGRTCHILEDHYKEWLKDYREAVKLRIHYIPEGGDYVRDSIPERRQS